MKVKKDAQTMAFFLEESGDWMGHTRLVKLLYLADLEARKVRGSPITSFRYLWHHHGPWDTGFFRARMELLAAGVAEPREVPHLEYTDRQLRSTGETPLSFTDEERHILTYVARTYMGTPLATLLNEVVYKTPPMKAASAKGDALAMEMVDNTELLKMGGASLADMLEAERTAAEGDFLLAGEFFDGLLAQAPAPDSTTNP